MLDENLPVFFLKPSASNVKHIRDVYSSHQGADPAPTYALHNFDPASVSQAHKNCYGAALFDPYIPDVVYGEALARPDWTQPTLSAEEVRKQAGIPPPPQPILPQDFVIQLYNPDQQVRVEIKEGKWGSSDSYEFSMPEKTFRTPSASNLDRGQSDPATLASTPKLLFVWRRESKLSKEFTCYMIGKSTDLLEKKKRNVRKDPDIAIALWRNLRELTVYEPNLQRLELEDPKGLEVVLLLGAVVIKDVYLAHKDHTREIFNISDVPGEKKLSGGSRKPSDPQEAGPTLGMSVPAGGRGASATPNHGSGNDAGRTSQAKWGTMPPVQPPRPPPADPRAQWQIDAETARLRAQAEAEAKAERRRKQEREKADEQEAKRLQKLVEEEEKAARRKQAEVDRETERLRKQYGVQELPHRPNVANSSGVQGHGRLQPARASNGLYTQPSASSSAVMMSGANTGTSSLTPPTDVHHAKKKKSFFGLRSVSDDAEETRARLNKKPSTMW